MSNTMNWAVGLFESKLENEELHRQLQQKEDTITALQTRIAVLETCIKVIEARIPRSETRTVNYL